MQRDTTSSTKKIRGIKIRPNLTKKGVNYFFEAVQIVENIEKVNFVFADAHGDIKLRPHEPHKGQHVWLFYSMN